MTETHPNTSQSARKPGGGESGRLHDGNGHIHSGTDHEKSLPHLVQDAFGHAAGLIQDEVRLARNEVMEGVHTMQGGAISVGVGVAVLLPGVTLLLYAAAIALQAAGLALWLGAAIVGIVAAVIGAIFLMQGKSKMKPENLGAPRAAEDVKRTATLAKEQTQ